MTDNNDDSNPLLPRRNVLYCAKCGMPPEYCEYGPDFETHCEPWLQQYHPALAAELAEKRGGKKPRKTVTSGEEAAETKPAKPPKPAQPWTVEERLRAFYEKYQPDKVDNVPSLLEKYAGKEDNLFTALTRKYGPEPEDPYYAEDSDEEEEDDEGASEEDEAEKGGAATTTEGKKSRSKRRGVGAKKAAEGGASKGGGRVVVQKVSQKKRRHLTVISGMETVLPDIKLKDVSKTFSKRFAGSSSVKDNAATKSKEIIIQGDHMYDVAEMIVDKFNVPESCVFLDIDGDIVPLR